MKHCETRTPVLMLALFLSFYICFWMVLALPTSQLVTHTRNGIVTLAPGAWGQHVFYTYETLLAQGMHDISQGSLGLATNKQQKP